MIYSFWRFATGLKGRCESGREILGNFVHSRQSKDPVQPVDEFFVLKDLDCRWAVNHCSNSLAHAGGPPFTKVEFGRNRYICDNRWEARAGWQRVNSRRRHYSVPGRGCHQFMQFIFWKREYHGPIYISVQIYRIFDGIQSLNGYRSNSCPTVVT
jgi:hypothetical protein